MSDVRILFGFHAVLSRLRQHAASVQEVLVDQDRVDARMKDLLQMAEGANVRVMHVERARLDGMAGGNARHQGVIARVVDTPIPYKDIHDILESDLKEPPFFLVLDGVEDPHNLGACLRVADAMGVHAVIAPKDRAAGLNATVRKVACGAAETVPFIAVTNLARTLRELKDAGVFIVGAAAEADADLPSTNLSGPLALVLGAEGSGLRRLTQETCDSLISIPMFGSVESLNVSVASGICLYEARRQRILQQA
ncbi:MULTISPECIES: 23S rRNA (guanosine(2251)-2'-O)-methyltransferase RlmB [Methylobacillus]|uniref:23S rRNA (guanosine-2'-O-)-methyltransferase RlmB n=1 Tax=Methylobacillus flagellatus (strain ATCC 51484 / DSM 6875 / VKM B-1610 / KT) TaxID=265072 RepID=Q1H0U4_METFK|nr:MULTISPECIES: 23S rRNA (guanosine(2251)-2'-O)-methyltransferase RlmB [Methylobacillus]ABE49893.1 23S rRNA Gm-2251 2'-O-methyltransferase [Methylobacillus flagellatus KT]MPS48882.1 23S rRNA (guanosine(2251)-2'-O)-methyltransferase RlmB [Methylobacillus sp.]